MDDLDATVLGLSEAGAVLTQAPRPSRTGVFAYLRHPDGALVEYVQWKPELLARIL